jgi:N-acetylmuramoyl-L-alanine amidase
MALSADTPLRIEALAQPMRLVVDMAETTFQASSLPAARAGLVLGFRAGLVRPGRSRLVFDLAQPARAVIETSAQQAGIVQVVIRFEPVSREAFEAAAREGADLRARAALEPVIPAAPTADSRPVVVLDPGHGGIDPGAVTPSGMAEKTIVLDIAHKLRAALEREGRVRVLMTRADDRFLTLSERVRMAREAEAALFVSLHADSLSAAQDVRGATVYTGSERATDAESARLAQKENAADAVGGGETVEATSDVSDILADLARRESRALSQIVAAGLVNEMSGAIRMHRIPQRQAGFRVLTAPDVPSVLIELGYLSSRQDLELLLSDDWQNRAANAIARAISRHFDTLARKTGSGVPPSP